MPLHRTATVLICIASAGLLSGCATVAERRVETGLVEAGIPAAPAACMANDWVDKLSTNQIRGIARFADSVRDDGDTLTASRLIAHAAEWNDPEALGVVTASAVRCAFE